MTDRDRSKMPPGPSTFKPTVPTPEARERLKTRPGIVPLPLSSEEAEILGTGVESLDDIPILPLDCELDDEIIGVAVDQAFAPYM